MAEDDDPWAQVRHGGQGVLEQRAPAHLGELLGAAEAAALARRQDDAGGGHATDSSISSASASSEAIEFPGSRWSTCGSAARMPAVSGS